MKVIMLYRPNSEHAGTAEDYAEEYHRRHSDKQIELVSVDTLEGADKARLYGVTRYPAILALSDDGSFLQLWQDDQLPLMSEVDFYQQV